MTQEEDRLKSIESRIACLEQEPISRNSRSSIEKELTVEALQILMANQKSIGKLLILSFVLITISIVLQFF